MNGNISNKKENADTPGTDTNYFLVLNPEGGIISSNKEARSLSPSAAEPQNINEIFDKQTSSKLISRINELLGSEKASLTEKTSLYLLNGEEIFAALSLSKHIETGEPYIIFRFKHEGKPDSVQNYFGLVFRTDVSKLFGEDEKLVSIFNSIKAVFPFTFIEKEKLRKTIDSLTELFWIKDSTGKFILVNEKLAQKFGLRATQIEGREEIAFIPEYLQEFYSALQKFISQSLNAVSIKGIPFRSIPADEKYEMIELPLLGEEDTVLAIIGVARAAGDKPMQADAEEVDFFLNMLLIFPHAFALINNEGLIKHASGEFCKLFQLELKNIRSRSFSEILPDNISGFLQNFIESQRPSDRIELLDARFSSSGKTGNYIVSINRIYDDEKNPVAVSLLIEEQILIDNIENLIKHRGRMYEVLIKNNPEPIFIYDKENLIFLDVNDAAQALYGYTRDEFLQMDLTDLYTPEDIQTLLDSSSERSKEGVFTGPFRHKKKDGASVFVEICKMSFSFGESDAHFNIVRDISKELDLERQVQLFKKTFDSTGDFVFITDNAGFITFINKAVEDFLGYSNNDLQKTAFAALVKDEERGLINTTIFQSHLNEEVTLRLELKKSIGELVEVELNASPILDFNNEVDSYIIIGKYKAPVPAPEEIIKEVEVIKEVIVEKPVQVAEDVKTEQDEKIPEASFLSSVFHEVLTPINVILGFVQELTESIETFTPEQKEAVDIINQNRISLLNIMNSIIEYTQIQEKTVELQPKDVNITEVIEQLQKDIDDLSSKGIQFAYGKISSSLNFETDKTRFQTFISLALKIAAKISREKKIYFSAYPFDENHFSIAFRDGYSSVSQLFFDHFRDLLHNRESTLIKHYGISKLSLGVMLGLFKLLKGEFRQLDTGDDRLDYVLIFPNSLTRIIEEPEQPSAPEERITEPEDKQTDAAETEEGPVVEEVIQEEIPLQTEDMQTGAAEPEIIEEDIPLSQMAQEVSSVEQTVTKEQVKEPQFKSLDFIDLSKYTCLYIEDQVDSQILFKVQMKELKEIKFAVSFEEALPLLDSSHFDFIVMDINLQGEYNGLDALKIIHKMPDYETIPIIAVTAYVLPGDKEKFIATGFSDFISKPIFREKMIEALAKIFT